MLMTCRVRAGRYQRNQDSLLCLDSKKDTDLISGLQKAPHLESDPHWHSSPWSPLSERRLKLLAFFKSAQIKFSMEE